MLTTHFKLLDYLGSIYLLGPFNLHPKGKLIRTRHAMIIARLDPAKKISAC